MALLPGITLILGAISIATLRGRRIRAVSIVSAGLAIASVAAMAGQLPIETIVALWRPIELFGSSFTFAVDGTVWAILFLGSAAVLAEAILEGRSSVRLLYSALALAAIVGGNLLTIAMLWTLMILVETALRLRNSIEREVAMRKAAIQFIAVAAVLAAAGGGGSVTLLVFAALFRSVGGSDERFPFSLAIMPALGALALISRTAPDASLHSWIAAVAIAIALIQSLVFIPRLSSLALALVAAGLLVPQAVVWTSLAAFLLSTLAVSQAGGSRVAWFAVAILPSAFLASGADTALLLTATVTTMALAMLSRWLPFAGAKWPPGRVEAIAIAALIIPAVVALLYSGWLPNLPGALSAAVGMAAGYAIARSWSTLSETLLPIRPPLEDINVIGRTALAATAVSVRTIADVLEGESAVLWILLVILIVIVGLQGLIA